MNAHATASRAFLTIYGSLSIATAHLSAATITTLFSFDSTTSSTSQDRLLVDPAGTLFGNTYGGLQGAGTAFKFDSSTNQYKLVASFAGPDGSFPMGGLIKDSSGNLYGTTFFGGGRSESPWEGVGTAFRLDASNDYSNTTLAHFENSGVIHPNGGLIADSEGNLYGTATGDVPREGTVFKLDISKNYEPSILTKFFLDAPEPSLHLDSAGNLYGTTYGGSDAHPHGSIFKLDRSNSYSRTILAVFAGVDGAFPNGNLISDASGNLLGTTAGGGTNDLGTVFRLEVSNDYTISTIVNFAGDNGAEPVGGLLADAAGNLFGVTNSGGTGHGTVFKLEAANNFRLITLAAFNGDNGSGPLSGLAADGQGNLFGTTYSGGEHNRGTIFKIEESGFVVPEPTTSSMIWLVLSLRVVRRHERSRQ